MVHIGLFGMFSKMYTYIEICDHVLSSPEWSLKKKHKLSHLQERRGRVFATTPFFPRVSLKWWCPKSASFLLYILSLSSYCPYVFGGAGILINKNLTFPR